MPRDPDTTLICSPEKADCIHEAIVIVEQTAFDDSRTTETDCRCLPSCSDIEYPHKYSSVELSRKELVHFPDEIKGIKGGRQLRLALKLDLLALQNLTRNF